MIAGYESTQEQVLLDGLPFTLLNLSPCYPAGEREAVKRGIEHKLFEIFSPYMDG